MTNFSTSALAGKSYQKASGVYQITNTINGKRYIGSAVNFYTRIANHISSLRRRKTSCRLLQNAWDKYGQPAFQFDVLLVCEKEDLIHYEAALIELYRSADRDCGYNIAEAGNRLGCTHSDATKERISKAKTGRRLTAEHVAKIAASNIGRKDTEESKAKKRKPKTAEARARMSAAQKLRFSLNPLSAESRAKAAASLKGHAAHNKGKKASAETRAKQSAAKKGKRPWNYGVPMGDEQRAVISERQKGGKQSAESNARRAATLRGRKQPPEEVAKRTASVKAYWANRKTEQH